MENNLLKSAMDIGKYLLVTLVTYISAFVAFIVLGFIDEEVVPAIGLNQSGAAVTAIDALLTVAYAAITAIAGIVTVVTGLMTLNVVLTAFGIKLNLNMGSVRA